MKKLTIVLLILLSISGKIFSQSEEKIVIKINPLSVFLGTGSMFIEGKLDDAKSFQMGVSYTGLGFDDFKYSGIVLTPEVRFYVKKRAMSGGYIAPYLRFRRYSITDKGDNPSELTLTTYGGGLLFGRQWIFDSGFVFDMFAGPSYSESSFKYKSGTDIDDNATFGLTGFWVRIGIALGFGF